MAIVFLMLIIVFSANKVSWITEALRPLIYAFILAYLLDSVVKFFMRIFKIRRGQSILLACMVLIGIIVLISSIIVPKVMDNINAVASFFIDGNWDINDIVTSVRDKIDNEYVEYAAQKILETSESIQRKLNEMLLYMSNIFIQILTGIGSKTLAIVTSFIICIYMLIEKDDLIARGKRLIYAYLKQDRADKIIYIARKANSIFKSFLNGKILDAFIVGIACIIAFSIFSVPYAPLMGSMIGVFNMIPYFGPIIGSVPVVIVSFFVEPTKAITALIIILVIQQIDGNYIDPKIVGNNIGVSPFWVITAVTVCGAAVGPVGMIFGVPLVVLVKTILEESIETRLSDKGMGEFEQDKLKINHTRKKKKKKK